MLCVECVNDHYLLSSKEFVMGALVTEEVAKGVAEVQVTVHGHEEIDMLIYSMISVPSDQATIFQVESGKVVTNKDICKMVDKAGRIALPCIETLGKVGLFERMVLTKML